MNPTRMDLRRHRRRCTAAVATAFVGLSTWADATEAGQALCLDGEQSHLEVVDAPGLHAPSAFTVSAWFRVDKVGGWQALFWKGDQPDSYPFGNREFGLFLHNGSVHLSSTPVSRQHRGHIYLDAPHNVVHAGRWQHVAAVLTSDVDGGAMRIYVDGELAASRPYGRGGIVDATGPLWIGGIPGRGADFHGLVDEAQLWQRALTGEEIRAGMNRALRGDEPGLMAYYRFDDPGLATGLATGLETGLAMGPLVRVQDHSLHGHHGRLVSGAYLRGSSEPPVAPYVALMVAAAPAVVTTTTTTTTSMPLMSVPVLASAPPPMSSAPLLAAVRNAAPSGSIAGPDAELVIQAPDHHDWEHKWSAQGPDFWGLEEQGVLARYNRAEGLFLGWRQPRKYRSSWGVANYGEVGRGMASGSWRWQAGGELFTYYGPPTASSHLAAIGVELHDLTDSQDGWLISAAENTLNAVLLRRDYRDYYRRTGGSLYTAHNVGGVLQVGARWSRDRLASMGQSSDWALLGDNWSEPAFRANPAADEGTVISARADVQLDTRNHVGQAERGWFINAYAERSGGVLGGDFRFKRYLLDLRRYQPVGPGTRLDLRLRGGTAKGDLPEQYVYRLGGFGSVRGYGFKAFAGDRSVLLNTQYWIDADRHWGGQLPLDGLGLGVFFDAGAAWFAHDRSDPFTGFRDLALGVETAPEWRRSVGLAVGTSDEGLRLEFTRVLDDDPGALAPAAAGWSMTARISRAF